MEIDIMDISLESLTLVDNATHWDNNPPSGILTLTWLYPRVNMDKPFITWVKTFGAVPDNFNPQLNKLDWFEKLAFRQTTDSQSVIIAEFAIVKDNGLMADIVNAILGFGLTTAGGLIAQPILGSVFSAVTSNIKVPEQQVTLLARGVGEINPKAKSGSIIDIPLLVPNDIVVVKEVSQTIPSHVQKGILLKQGADNGLLKLVLT